MCHAVDELAGVGRKETYQELNFLTSIIRNDIVMYFVGYEHETGLFEFVVITNKAKHNYFLDKMS